jgi:hypothetical protein
LAATSPGVGTIERRRMSSASGLEPHAHTGRSGGQMHSTANSDRQARAIADAIVERIGSPLSVEGLQTATWILMDYGDVVFHVFQAEARRFYALERLWGDAQNETGRFAASS